MKCEGIQGIRRLAKHHSEVLVTQLHTVTLAIIAEVRCVMVIMRLVMVIFFLCEVQYSFHVLALSTMHYAVICWYSFSFNSAG